MATKTRKRRSRSSDPMVRAGYRKTKLHSGERKARARGIIGYRMVRVKGHPNTYIRVAITKKRGKRGGRTVAVSKLEKVGRPKTKTKKKSKRRR